MSWKPEEIREMLEELDDETFEEAVRIRLGEKNVSKSSPHAWRRVWPYVLAAACMLLLIGLATVNILHLRNVKEIPVPVATLESEEQTSPQVSGNEPDESTTPQESETVSNIHIYHDESEKKTYFDKIKALSTKTNVEQTCDEIMIGRKMYFAVRECEESENEDGYMETNHAHYAFYCYNFDRGTLEQLYLSDDYPDVQVKQLLYNDGKFYIEAELQTKRFEEAGLTQQEYDQNFDQYFDQRIELLGITYDHFVYDLETQTLYSVPIEMNGGQIFMQGFWNGYLYAVRDETQIWSFDIKDGTAALVMEDDRIRHYELYQSTDFMLYGVYDQQFKLTWYMIDEAGQEHVGHLPRQDMNLSVRYESAGLVYIAWIPQTSNSTDDEWEYEEVNREDFKQWFEE